MDVQRVTQSGIRNLHLLLAKRRLPKHIGICLHSLEESSWSSFTELVTFLKRLGYDFVGCRELYRRSVQRSVFLSFDDNYQSWYRAGSLLRQLDVTATFYVNTLPLRDRATPAEIDDYYNRIAHQGDRTPLSANEIRELADMGNVIGSHTHSHADLGKLGDRAAQDEILKGKMELERIVGLRVDHFSIPFGMRRHFNQSLEEYCRSIGIETIAYAIPALQHRAQRPFAINRNVWHLDMPLDYNVENLCIDGRVFSSITGRSAVG